jgi:two-component system, OmpR family, sensor kinase
LPEQEASRSIALVCDAANRVRSVLHNPAGLPATPGDRLIELFAPGSRNKALRLLQSIRDRQAAFGWELDVRGRGEVMVLHFCGASMREGILIVGAGSQPYTNALFSRLLQGIETSPPREEVLSTQDTLKLYEQLAGLNNQLLSMQRELEKKNAELTRLLEDRARLAAIAAHDLRTPLQVIETAAAALEQMAGGQGAWAIDAIRRNAHAMDIMVQDLLCAYQPDIGMLVLSVQPIDLEALVHLNVQNNRAVAAQKNITLTFSSNGAVHPVLGDPLRLDQVLNNLVHNAIKFSQPGTTIGIGVFGTESDASFSVEDEGVGLSKEQLDSLLHCGVGASQPGTRAEAGFGLGFFIIRSIVERHHGTIEAQSLPGKGTRFSVRLPVCRRAEA